MRVEAENISKRYRYEWVLKNVTASFSSHHQYAISGPNGSGKSTVLRMLSGHLTPTEGKITFFQQGKKMDVGDVYTHLTFAAPYIDLIETFTLREIIQFHTKFKKLQNQMSVSDFMDILALPKAKNKQVRHFSSGMKQRLKLGLAICSESDLLLLDEPTSNLDQQGIQWYRNLVDQFAHNRLLIIASNADVDFDFCSQRIVVTDYKKGKSKRG